MKQNYHIVNIKNGILNVLNSIRCFFNFHECKYYETEHGCEGLLYPISGKQKP